MFDALRLYHHCFASVGFAIVWLWRSIQCEFKEGTSQVDKIFFNSAGRAVRQANSDPVNGEGAEGPLVSS